MKRTWTKKVKAVPHCAASNNSTEEPIKQVQPQVKRRVRTSAAMIGLIVSTGASNLLMTKPSDSAPAEAIVQESMSKDAISVAKQTTDSVEPEVPLSTLGDALVISTAVELQPQTATVSTPVLPKIEQSEQKQKVLSSLSPTTRVVTTQVMQPSVPETLPQGIAASTNSVNQQPDLQIEKALKARRINLLIQRLKAGRTVATSSQLSAVNQSQNTPPITTAVSEPQAINYQAKGSALTSKQRLLVQRLSEVNQSQKTPFITTAVSEPQAINHQAKGSALTSKQRLLVERLQEKPNHFKERLATKPQSLSGGARQQQINWRQALSVERQETSQVVENEEPQPPLVSETLTPQETRTEVKTTSQASFSAQASTQSVGIVAELPKSAVNQPTVVVPSVTVPLAAPSYQVRAGDTLTAIARQHRVSLAELVEVNQLGNPNQLQIHQKLKIPTPQYNNPVNQRLASDNQQKTLAVPLEPLAGSPSLNAGYTGMGGNISDDDTVQASPPIAEIQRRQSVAQQELQSNLYVQNLRTEIQELRQKYNNQPTLAQPVPVVNQSSSVPATAANSSTGTSRQLRLELPENQPINPEFRPIRSEQKQRPILAKPTQPQAKARNKVATAPTDVNVSESLQSMRGQPVSPELPPLGAVDTYLPQPASGSLKPYMWPAKGALTSGYGWRWGRMHKGIDIAAPIGTPVVAAAPGVVVKAGWNAGGYGNLVDIQHTDGSVTRYAHNKRILVQPGQQVEQGQQIAEMGSTGFSTGPHLHFEVHPLGKKAVNPIAFLPR